MFIIRKVNRPFFRIHFVNIKFYGTQQLIEKTAMHIGMKRKMYMEILKQDEHVALLPAVHLKRTLQAIKNVGFLEEQIISCPSVLHIPADVVNSRIMLLQEFGIDLKNITPIMIVNFNKFCLTKIRVLRLHRLIPKKLDIVDNIYKYLSSPLPAGEMCTVSDDCTIRQAWKIVLRHYLMSTINIAPEWNPYGSNKCTSFRIIHQNMYICKMILKLSDDKIIRYTELLHKDPKNMMLLINAFKELNAGDVLLKMPSLTKLEAENVAANYSKMKRYGIENEIIESCPAVFTLQSQILHRSLNEMLIFPELRIFYNHPKCLNLIKNYLKVKERLAVCRRLGISTINIDFLCCSDLTFVRCLLNGVSTKMAHAIAHYLSKKLKRSALDILQELKKHPYVNYVSMVTVRRTLDMLQEMGFTNDVIFHSIQIVLYPSGTVKPILMNLYNKGNECGKAITLNNILPLTLYYLECDNCFSGAAIWSDDAKFVAGSIDKEEIDNDPIAVAC